MSAQLECVPKISNADVPEKATKRPTFTPRADIYETENSFVVFADLPGAHEDSVDITVEKNVLSIRATVAQQSSVGLSLAYAEYNTGDYERQFALPNEIDRDDITASMKNGVLKLVLPKSANGRLKKINVVSE